MTKGERALAHLRSLAEAATPGPRQVKHFTGESQVYPTELFAAHCDAYRNRIEADLALAAATNREVMLTLLDIAQSYLEEAINRDQVAEGLDHIADLIGLEEE